METCLMVMEWQYLDALLLYCIWALPGDSNHAIDDLIKRQRWASACLCSNVRHPNACRVLNTLACLSKLLVVQRAAFRWTCSIWEIRSFVCGSHTAEAYSSCGLTKVLKEPRQEKTCLCHMRTTKAQISLHIRAVWSAPLLFTVWIV